MSDHDQTGTLSRERFLLESARQERLDRESEAQRQWLLECLAAARQEGAAEMRERAAQHCDEPAKRLREELGWSAEAELLERYAAAIRALPLTPEEPG